ncbi:MAG TPA: hypothetical protein VG267_18490 [Terracidiphilus sp.]|jgi:hypothetical protein|nr:hypothetical protein [Terracidiphilus sp.]
MDSLEAYDHWVSNIVLPIAFQWIEEHKQEVYANIPTELREDIGVVISAAFEQVRQMPYYQEGVEMGEAFARKRKEGTLDTSQYNPVWTEITRRVRKEVEAVFQEYKGVLKHSGED